MAGDRSHIDAVKAALRIEDIIGQTVDLLKTYRVEDPAARHLRD